MSRRKKIISSIIVILCMPVLLVADDSCLIVKIIDECAINRFAKLDDDEVAWRCSGAIYYQSLTSGEIINLSDGISGFHGIPCISDGQVAWRVWDGAERTYIYFWDGNETKIVADFPAGDFPMPWGYPPSYHSVDVSLDHGHIAYAGWDGSDYEIFLFDGENVHRITDNSRDDYEPQLCSGQIAWTADMGEGEDIFFWNGNSIQNVSNRPNSTDQDPHLMNGTIAWCGWNSETGSDIYYWGGQTTTVISLPGNDYEPQIDNSGTFVTWDNKWSDQYDVYVWDRQNIITLASSPDYTEISPFANLGKIIFSKHNGSGYDIYLAEFKSQADFDGDGDVDGSDLAVFAEDFGRTDCDIGPECEGDFDDDNDMDGSDLALFATDFGRTRCTTWEY